MATWPADNQKALIAYYGTPKSAALESQLVDVVPPFKMYYEGKPVKAIKFHKKCAFALLAALNEIWDQCKRDQKQVDAIFASVYDGAYNPRKIAGSSNWSSHAFAAAIDINAAHNGFNTGHGNMHPIVIAAFKRQGARWGGDYHGRTDPMHFEFIAGGTIAEPPSKTSVPTITKPIAPVAPTPVPISQPTTTEAKSMDIIALLPLFMQALSIGSTVVTTLNGGGSILELIKTEAPTLINLFTSIGSKLYPDLTPHDQVQVAAMIIYDKPTVTKVQAQLNTIGQDPPLIVDGSLGAKTKAAVMAFQKAKGLADVDGWPGPLTQAALAMAAIAPKATAATVAAINAAPLVALKG